MSDDLAGDEARGFAFWSKGELARIAMMTAVAAYPLSVVAFEGPDAPRPRISTLEAPTQPLPQPGRLRSVRMVDFDIVKIGIKAMGDLDEPRR